MSHNNTAALLHSTEDPPEQRNSSVELLAGQGRHTFLDGSYYEGSWVAGERREGAFRSGDGALEYRGQWRGQLRHGQGGLFHRGLFKYTGGHCS